MLHRLLRLVARMQLTISSHHASTHSVICLRAHRKAERLTSCSGRSMSEPLISSFNCRIALPIVTDIGRAATRWLICGDRYVMRWRESVLFGGVT